MNDVSRETGILRKNQKEIMRLEKSEHNQKTPLMDFLED
jgi:hypothetical protein